MQRAVGIAGISFIVSLCLRVPVDPFIETNLCSPASSAGTAILSPENAHCTGTKSWFEIFFPALKLKKKSPAPV